MVHYQIPASADVYVHRSGRTARAAQDGLAVALVTPREAPRFAALLRVILFAMHKPVTYVLRLNSPFPSECVFC